MMAVHLDTLATNQGLLGTGSLKEGAVSQALVTVARDYVS